MKILIITQQFTTAIGERVQALRHAGAEVFLVALELNNQFKSKQFIYFDYSNNVFSDFNIGIKLFKLFAWCDLVHWHGANIKARNLCLFLQQTLKKPAVIEFKNEDIFIPEIEFTDNIKYRTHWFHKTSAHSNDYNSSVANQIFFSKYHFTPITNASASQYLLPDFFPPPLNIKYPVFSLSNKIPLQNNNQKPVVAINRFSIDNADDVSLTEEISKIKNENFADVVEIKSKRNIDIAYAIREADMYVGSVLSGNISYWDWYALSQEKILLPFIKPFLANGIYKNVPLVNCFANNLYNSLTEFLKGTNAIKKMRDDVSSYNRLVFNADIILKAELQFYKRIILSSRKKN